MSNTSNNYDVGGTTKAGIAGTEVNPTGSTGTINGSRFVFLMFTDLFYVCTLAT